LTQPTLIAIVDDDLSVREALTSLMKSLGCAAVAFERADEFLKTERSNVSCLIADVQMPNMTGPELFNHLVATGEAIPTILISAYPDQKVRSRAVESGVKCYLTKPFREEDLINCIESAIGPLART
jgi:FixJ family two-component response regulator